MKMQIVQIHQEVGHVHVKQDILEMVLLVMVGPTNFDFFAFNFLILFFFF